MYITHAGAALEGGRGSGNFEHSGRKGKLGGSGKGGGSSALSEEWTGTDDVRAFYEDKLQSFDEHASK